MFSWHIILHVLLHLLGTILFVLSLFAVVPFHHLRTLYCNHCTDAYPLFAFLFYLTQPDRVSCHAGEHLLAWRVLSACYVLLVLFFFFFICWFCFFLTEKKCFFLLLDTCGRLSQEKEVNFAVGWSWRVSFRLLSTKRFFISPCCHNP